MLYPDKTKIYIILFIFITPVLRCFVQLQDKFQVSWVENKEEFLSNLEYWLCYYSFAEVL